MSYAKFVHPHAPKTSLMTLTRKAHRWVGMIFLMTVAANLIAMAFGKAPVWVTYAPLPFLFAMMATGLVMEVEHFTLKAPSR